MLQERDVIARSCRNPFKQCLVKAVSLETSVFSDYSFLPPTILLKCKSLRSRRLRERGGAGSSAAAAGQAPHAENQVFSQRVEGEVAAISQLQGPLKGLILWSV